MSTEAPGRNDERLRERVARWDQIRREHFSFTINLFLTFAIGALGFLAAMLLSGGFHSFTPFQQEMFVHSFGVLGVSAASGVAATISRLCDFRLTAQIVRRPFNAQKPLTAHWLRTARKWTDWLGDFSWAAFWIQAVTFTLAVLLAGIAVVSVAVSG